MDLRNEKKRLWLILQVLSFGLFIEFIFNTLKKGKEADKVYISTSLAGKVDTIYGYARGYPIVSLSGHRVKLLDGGPFSEYLSIGDSVTKEHGSEVLKTYRLV